MMSACESSKNSRYSDEVVDVSYNSMKGYISASTIISPDFVDIIRLSNDCVTMGLVKSFKPYGDCLYVLNESGNAIYIFKDNGELESVISRYGNAGDEYSDITDFCVDSNNVYILDQNKQKIHHLLNDGKYIGNIDISSIWGNQIFIVDHVLYVINNASDTEIGKYHLFKIEKNKIEPYLPFSTASGLYMKQSHAGPFVFIRENNTLYKIEDGNPKEVLKLNFGSLSLPETLIGADALQLMQNGAVDKYVLGIDRIQTDGNLIFLYCSVKSEPKVIVYDFYKKEIVEFCSGFRNDMFLGIGLMNYTITENNLYDLYYADELCTILENSNDSMLSEKYKIIRTKLLSEMSPEDNPIIFKYKML